MKIVPVSSVEYIDNVPYIPTNTQLESYLYDAEAWTTEYDEDTERVIVTFAEIKEMFDAWDQSELDEADRDPTVYDYLVNCIGNGFHPCRII